MLDFISGPIWYEYFDPITFERKTNIDIIDNDEPLKLINDTIQNLYSSYYEFNSHNQACWFNEE